MYSEEQYYKALKVYEETKSVTKTITILGYPARRQTLYNWINRKRILPEVQKSPSQAHLHAVLAPPCRSFSPTFTH